MKPSTILLPLLLGTACTPVDLRERMATAPQAGPCAIDDVVRGRWIGQHYRGAMRDVIQRQANAALARVIAPGDMATNDVREDRLDILLDDGGAIEGLRCG